jgi:hypothetical protein
VTGRFQTVLRNTLSELAQLKKVDDWLGGQLRRYAKKTHSPEEWADRLRDLGKEVNKKLGPPIPLDYGSTYFALAAGAPVHALMRAVLAKGIPRTMAAFLRATTKPITTAPVRNAQGNIVERLPLDVAGDPWEAQSFYRFMGAMGVGGGAVVLPPKIRNTAFASEAVRTHIIGAVYRELYAALGREGMRKFSKHSRNGHQLYLQMDGQQSTLTRQEKEVLVPKLRAIFVGLMDAYVAAQTARGVEQKELPGRIRDYMPHMLTGLGRESFGEYFSLIKGRKVGQREVGEAYTRYMLEREGVPEYRQDFMESFDAYVNSVARAIALNPVLDAIREYGNTEGLVNKSRWDATRSWANGFRWQDRAISPKTLSVHMSSSRCLVCSLAFCNISCSAAIYRGWGGGLRQRF